MRSTPWRANRPAAYHADAGSRVAFMKCRRSAPAAIAIPSTLISGIGGRSFAISPPSSRPSIGAAQTGRPVPNPGECAWKSGVSNPGTNRSAVSRSKKSTIAGPWARYVSTFAASNMSPSSASR